MTEGPVPWTVVRATQFHEYLAAMLGAGARYDLLPVPPGLVQPVASAEVARLIAEVAVAGPWRGRVETRRTGGVRLPAARRGLAAGGG